MFRRIRAKGTPALLVSMLAVVLACSGTAVAGQALITGKNVKDSSLTGKDIKDKSLGAKDFKGSVQGPQGAQGAQGAQGPQGPAGFSDVKQVAGPMMTLCPESGGTCAVNGSQAACPAGYVVLGGGWDGGDDPLVVATAAYNKPVGQTWTVIMVNNSSISGTFRAVATCAPGSASAVLRSASASPSFAEMVERARQAR